MSAPLDPHSEPDPLAARLRAALAPEPGAARRVIARALAGSPARRKARLNWVAAGSLAGSLLLLVVYPYLPGRPGAACAPGGEVASIESRGSFLITRSEASGKISIRQSGAPEPPAPGTILIVRHGESS